MSLILLRFLKIKKYKKLLKISKMKNQRNVIVKKISRQLMPKLTSNKELLTTHSDQEDLSLIQWKLQGWNKND